MRHSVYCRESGALKRFPFARLLGSIAALAFIASPAWATYSRKQLAPGVTLVQEICTDVAAPLIVNAMTVDLSAQGVMVKAAIGQDVVLSDDWRKGREAMSRLTARRGAMAGFNADFFPFTGDPLSVCIVDGELISEPQMNRVALGILRNKGAFFDNPRFAGSIRLSRGVSRQIDGVNRVRETNQLIVYTEAFGASTQNKFKATDVICSCDDLPVQVGKRLNLTVKQVVEDAVNTPISGGSLVLSAGGPAGYFLRTNLKPGDTLTAEFEMKSASCYDWSLVEQAVGGGPWLLKEGKPYIDAADEGFSNHFVTTCHPRTAVGLTRDKRLVIVTVDGRQFVSAGISLTDLASLMARLGCVDAINLDGGGSTTFSVQGIVVNSISEGDERPVASGLLVFAAPEDPEQLPKLAIAGVGHEVVSGQGTQLSLVYGDDSGPLSPEQYAKVVWGSTNGVGFVNQMGYFTPIKLRSGTVNAIYGSQMVSAPVNVIAGPPAKIEAVLVPDKQDGLRAALNVKVFDASGNLLTGKEVFINVAGGKPDLEAGVTGERGELCIGITWDPASTVRTAAAMAGEIVADASLSGVKQKPVPTGRE